MNKYQLVFKIVSSYEEMQKAFFIRGVVFIEEQKCPYAVEHDEFDYTATHFIVEVDNEPIATARIRLYKGNIKFERLAVRKEYRSMGVGKALLEFVLCYVERLGIDKIVMHAQRHTVGFYEKYGFVKQGELFIEANIEHYYMEKVLLIGDIDK